MVTGKVEKKVIEVPLPFHLQFVAGAIAGVSEISAMYPLDVVKTRFQLQSVAHKQYRSIWSCMKQIISEEGFGTLYRGIAAPVLVEAPKRATKFAANEQYTKIVLELTGLPKLTQSLSIFTGVLSGVTEALVVSSFELVKVRMQDRAQATKYKSTWDCMALILREEGPLAFFRGLEATIWRHAAWNGAYFGIIHAVRDVIARIKLQSRTSILSPDGNTVQSDIGIPDERVMRRTKKSSLVENFVAGAIGGTFATALNTPFDVAKTLIQNSSPGGPRYMGSYAWPVMREVVKRDGFRALYRGFTPKVVRLGPGGGILLVVFDYVSRLLRDNLMDSHHAD